MADESRGDMARYQMSCIAERVRSANNDVAAISDEQKRKRGYTEGSLECERLGRRRTKHAGAALVRRHLPSTLVYHHHSPPPITLISL